MTSSSSYDQAEDDRAAEGLRQALQDDAEDAVNERRLMGAAYWADIDLRDPPDSMTNNNATKGE